MIPTHFNWAEFAWLFVSLLGILVSRYNLREGHDEQRAVEATGERNGRRFIAIISIWQDRIRMAIYLFAVGVGVLGGYNPAEVANPLGALIIILALAANVTIAVLQAVMRSVLNRRYGKTDPRNQALDPAGDLEHDLAD